MHKKRGMPDKKGQLTVFIIVGILLLIALLIFIYIRSIERQTTIAPELPPREVVPKAVEPVTSFTESCLSSLAADALKIAEEHGGYIYTDRLSASSSSTE